MQVHVFDFRWQPVEDNWEEFYCEIQAGKNNRFGRKKLWIGDELSIEIKSDVRCAGFRDGDLWKACPKFSTGKPKCEFCRAVEGSFVYTAFDGFDQSKLTAEDLQKIAGEHWVYLAFFADGIMKVGVSKQQRKFIRQLEQGSYATLFIAKTPDGIAARQIETTIRKSGLADKIKASQKKNLLCPEVTDPEGELRQVLADSLPSLNQYEHLKSFMLEEPEFFNWQARYGLEGFTNKIHNIALDIPGEWVSGKIRAIKGPFMVLETPEEFLNVTMKSLRGREIEFEPKPYGVNLNMALQGALF